MSFMLVSHGSSHLQFASDEGHHFKFEVVVSLGARRVRIGDVTWIAGRCPGNSAEVIEHASVFAVVCAQDYGLM